MCAVSIDHLWRDGLTRRQALPSLAGMLSAFDVEPICFANMTLRN